MLPQRRTSRHNANQQKPRPQRQQRDMSTPDALILPILTSLLFFPRHLIQPLPLPHHPIRNMQLLGVDEALLTPVRAEEQHASKRPVYGACPVGEEDEEADGEHVVAGHAVVGVGQVDGGNCVAVAEGEEGGLDKEEGGGCYCCRGEGEECWQRKLVGVGVG